MPIDIQPTLEAIQTLRFLPELERTEFYDSVVAPLIADNAAAVDVKDAPDTLPQWLHIQAATIDFAVEGITEVTYEINQQFPQELQQAVGALPPEQRIRLQRLLIEFEGGENLPAEFIEREEARRESALDAVAEQRENSPPSTTGIFGEFVGTATATSSRGFPIIRGTFSLFAGNGTTVDTFDVTTGGGARNFRTTNGPLPPGIYRVSNHRRNRTTAGMVFEGVGYSFDLDPANGTQVFGRSLFRIHPDGHPLGTNGCIGVRENAARLRRCEAHIAELLRNNSRGFKVAVRF